MTQSRAPNPSPTLPQIGASTEGMYPAYLSDRFSRFSLQLNGVTLESATGPPVSNRLQRLNGWQRLWLVATVALGLWWGGVWPLQVVPRSNYSSWDYISAIKQEFENPKCRDYQNLPLERLVEPDYGRDGRSCWHIYTSRKYGSSASLPYTFEMYQSEVDAEWRNDYLLAIALGLGGTLVASATVYFLGFLVGWIFKGFRRA